MIRTRLEIATGVLVALLLFSQTTGTNPSSKSGPAHVKMANIAARPEDVSSIDGIIKAYYEVVSGPAGKPRQWDRDRTLYIPSIRLVNLSEDKEGKMTARSLTHQEFADESDRALGDNAFYEREVHRITHRFGNAAHVLSTAEQMTTPEGPPTGHSIDSLELYWDGHRWWITNANIWPGDVPGRPLTKEFLP
jgi:hypothetical protein